MKILFNIHSLRIGGAETVVVNDLLAIRKLGHDVVLVVGEREESFLQDKVDQNGIRTISLMPQNSRSFFGKVKRLIAWKTINFQKRWEQILTEEKPDVVHLHSWPWILPFPSMHMVYTFHSDVERHLAVYGDTHRNNLIKLADEGVTFFCLSDRAKKDVQRIFHTERAVRIPNGVELEAIRKKTYDRTIFLRDLGISENAFILGHVGRIHPVKNHPKLLEIFKEVASRAEAYLILVGTGEAEYVEVIKHQAQALGIGGRVVFLGLRSDATEVMSTFDALVLPSLSESFSLTLVEAQALGVRCVASDVLPAEVVCNDNCFTLSLEESAEKWADYILGKFTQQKSSSLEQFDISNVAAQLTMQYAMLLQK